MILHPCDLGDLPEYVSLKVASPFLPIDSRNLSSNWKARYGGFVHREKSGLRVDVKAADAWLDERGKALLSPLLMQEKRRRNPGWVPAGERLQALAGRTEIMDHLVLALARDLHGSLVPHRGAA